MTRVRIPDLRDGRLEFVADFLTAVEADALQAALRNALPWRRDTVRMFGRVIEAPRLTAWVGDPGTRYTYAGTTREPLPWIAPLVRVRKRLGAHAPTVAWNAVLLNLYRDGEDHMGWHADDEPELGPAPWIASVSLGATRTFQLKHRTDRRRPRVDLELTHGSLLLMEPPTQAHWKHRVPKRRRISSERMNLTFRAVRQAT